MSKNYSLNATPPNEQRIPTEDVVIDPLVLTVGADSMAGSVTLQTIEMVHEALGVNINLGTSNVSFGLPERHRNPGRPDGRAGERRSARVR